MVSDNQHEPPNTDTTVWRVESLAKKWGVSPDTVRAAINSGQLAAVNVARSAGARPRWRITEIAWQAFLQTRSTGTSHRPEEQKPRPRRVTRARFKHYV